MRIRNHVLVWFGGLVLTAFTQGLTAAQDAPPGRIVFETRQTPRLTFHVDPALADSADRLTAMIERRVIEADEAAARRVREAAGFAGMVDAANALLGVSPDEELAQKQQEVGGFFSRLDWFVFAPADRLEVTLVDRPRALDHLRAGGKLPGVRYDQAEDRAYAPIDRVLNSDSPPEARWLTEITMSVRPGQPDHEVGRTWFSLVNVSGRMNRGLALHEVAELTLLSGWAKRRVDPHWRWFSDGVANAVTLRVLRNHGHADEAALMRDTFGTDAHAERQGTLNLRYWLEATYEPKVEALGESERRDARYAFATAEVERLIEDHGTGWIAEVRAELDASPRPGSALIVDAIQRSTGVDMDARLDAYQSFTDRDAEVLRLAEAYGNARAAENYDAAAVAAMRLLELQFVRRDRAPTANAYLAVVKPLTFSDHPGDALAVLRKIDEMFGDRLDRSDRLELAVMAALTAVRAGDLAAGDPLVQPMIDHQPDHALPLLFLAHRAHASGDPAAADRLARQAEAALSARADPDLRLGFEAEVRRLKREP
ncbi:MAG: hypothetical protein AAF800_02125 [Planctomycetota bacterium]